MTRILALVAGFALVGCSATEPDAGANVRVGPNGVAPTAHVTTAGYVSDDVRTAVGIAIGPNGVRPRIGVRVGKGRGRRGGISIGVPFF